MTRRARPTEIRHVAAPCALPPLATFEPCICHQDTHQHLANLVPSAIPADRNVAREDSNTLRVRNIFNTDGLAGAAAVARVPTGMCVGSHKRASKNMA